MSLNVSLSDVLGWIEVRRECINCKSPFSVRVLNPDGGPQRCDACCDALRESRLADERRQHQAHAKLNCGISDIYAEYDQKRDRGNILAKITAAKGDNLLILGAYQIGKTHCSCHAALRESDKGRTVRYVRYAQWLRGIVSTMGKDMEDAEEQIQQAQRCDLLIIDDFGKGKCTERVSEILFDVIDSREVARRPTWITSNLKSDEIEKHLGEDRGPAIMARIKRAYRVVAP